MHIYMIPNKYICTIIIFNLVSEICLEIAYLFVKLSTVGVHIVDIPVKDVGVPNIEKGLQLKDMDDETTFITVDTLYCIKGAIYMLIMLR